MLDIKSVVNSNSTFTAENFMDMVSQMPVTSISTPTVIGTPKAIAVAKSYMTRGDKMNLIQDVDIRCSKQELADCCDSIIDDNYDLNEQTTKQGRTCLILTFNDSNGECKLITQYDKTTDEVHITPFKLSSTNFVTNHNYDLQCILDTLSLAKAGTFVGCADNRATMNVNGKARSCSLGVVEEGVKALAKEIDSDVASIGFTIKKTIKQYLEEETELKVKLKGVKTQVELLNIVARHVLNERMTNGMEFDDFLDLFRQACLLGADDPTVLKFYKIVKV